MASHGPVGVLYFCHVTRNDENRSVGVAGGPTRTANVDRSLTTKRAARSTHDDNGLYPSSGIFIFFFLTQCERSDTRPAERGDSKSRWRANSSHSVHPIIKFVRVLKPAPVRDLIAMTFSPSPSPARATVGTASRGRTLASFIARSPTRTISRLLLHAFSPLPQFTRHSRRGRFDRPHAVVDLLVYIFIAPRDNNNNNNNHIPSSVPSVLPVWNLRETARNANDCNGLVSIPFSYPRVTSMRGAKISTSNRHDAIEFVTSCRE